MCANIYEWTRDQLAFPALISCYVTLALCTLAKTRNRKQVKKMKTQINHTYTHMYLFMYMHMQEGIERQQRVHLGAPSA